MWAWQSPCETGAFTEPSLLAAFSPEATGLLSTDLVKEEAPHNLTGQFQHAPRFCLEHDSLRLTLGLLTAV